MCANELTLGMREMKGGVGGGREGEPGTTVAFRKYLKPASASRKQFLMAAFENNL